MGKRLTIGVVLLAAGAGTIWSAPVPDKAKSKGEKVEFKVYSSYFESNKSGLKGDGSFLVFSDQAAFDQVLRPAPPLIGKKREYMPKHIFDSKMVVAAIKRGNKMWQYEVEKVTADKGTLYVQYKAVGKDGGTARFASPLVIAVDKGKYTSVVFIENGEKTGTATIGK